MESYNIKVLTPNNNRNKYFGVDYFANFYDGSNPSFRYFSSAVDELKIYKNEAVHFNKLKYQLFLQEIQDLEPRKIIGIFQNPDIYHDLDCIAFILDDLKKHDLGLFLETTSDKILTNLEELLAFSKTQPLIIAYPIYSYHKINLSFFDALHCFEESQKTLHKLSDSLKNVGLIIKPLIPRINDDSEGLEKLIAKANTFNLSFIYPSFSLYFDSFKLKNFYDIIDVERPELRNYYIDNFGLKYNWESQNFTDLKKIFIFNTKKTKLKYAMRDIIALYRDDEFTQLKLF